MRSARRQGDREAALNALGATTRDRGVALNALGATEATRKAGQKGVQEWVVARLGKAAKVAAPVQRTKDPPDQACPAGR